MLISFKLLVIALHWLYQCCDTVLPPRYIALGNSIRVKDTNHHVFSAATQTKQQLMKNRWHLAYTLIKNPGLMQHRVHHQSKQHEERLLLYIAKKELLGKLNPQDKEVPSKEISMELHRLDGLLDDHMQDMLSSIDSVIKQGDNVDKDTMVIKVLQDDTLNQDAVYKDDSQA